VSEQDSLSVNVGRQILARRKSLGWTAVDLAARLTAAGHRIDRLGQTRIAQGGRRVDVDELAALAKVFGVADPWELTVDVPCEKCAGSPPPGYRCMACDRSGAAA
jgi:transcriptional regulator with XRE-family HTH domain